MPFDSHENNIISPNDPFISRLSGALHRSLPGEAAHKKLYPSYRSLVKPKDTIIDAAILITLFREDGKFKTVLIKRPEYNGHHSGQVSFPGGKKESFDTGLEATALRETYEETGIDQVQILGKLTPIYIPVSGFRVHPFIGLIADKPHFKPDPGEVAYLIITDLESMISGEIQSKPGEFEGKSFSIPYYDIEKEFVWGATAMIISEFIELVKPIL